jgi:hypothetical protein
VDAKDSRRSRRPVRDTPLRHDNDRLLIGKSQTAHGMTPIFKLLSCGQRQEGAKFVPAGLLQEVAAPSNPRCEWHHRASDIKAWACSLTFGNVWYSKLCVPVDGFALIVVASKIIACLKRPFAADDKIESQVTLRDLCQPTTTSWEISLIPTSRRDRPTCRERQGCSSKVSVPWKNYGKRPPGGPHSSHATLCCQPLDFPEPGILRSATKLQTDDLS